MAIRIVITSNSADYRRMMRAALEPNPEFEICGEAAALDELPDILHEFKPDIVLLESSVVKSEEPIEPHVVQFQGHEVKIVVVRQLEDGSLDLASPEGLSIRVGEDEIPDHFASTLLTISGLGLAQEGVENLAEEPQMIEPLTDKEQEILERMAEGKSNSEIAEDLVISKNTVRYHIGNILQKLTAANRTHAVVEAIKKRILKI